MPFINALPLTRGPWLLQELVTELVLDVEVALAKGHFKFWKETWFIMASFVLACNWASILLSGADTPVGLKVSQCIPSLSAVPSLTDTPNP